MNAARFVWGPLSRLGLFCALAVFALDQIFKVWLLQVFDLASKGRVKVMPFVDFVLIWNKGISYGLFQQNTAFGQWALLGFKAIAVILLWAWLARTQTRLAAISLGLIIGGALGNALDRLVHGAVADFVLLHTQTVGYNFTWYVFNLADAAIVAGVAGLLYESLIGSGAAKAP